MDYVRHDDQALSNFVRQSALMHSLFLLMRESDDFRGRDGIEALRRFAIWFVIEGRHLYALPAVIDRSLVAAITRLDAQGCHTLMRQLARRSGENLDGAALRMWYRREAVPRHRIAPFLGDDEIAAMAPIGGELAAVNDATSRIAKEGGRTAIATSAFAGPREATVAWALDGMRPTVSIVGFHRSVMGLGEDARCLFECLRHVGIAAELVDVSPPGLETLEALNAFAPYEATRPTGSVVIFCLPAFEMMDALAKLNFAPARGRYLIGYWPWETTALPPMWDHVYHFVDEIWASSRFLRQVYGPKTAKPVIHVPLHVRVDAGPLRPDLKAIFDEAFSFLTVFDFNSYVARKNPEGTIDAFIRAFPRGAERVQLILKTLHGHQRPSDLEHIVDRARQDGRIIVIDGALSRADVCGMIRTADAYVSLHRAEGFGRPIAEAMMLETPVVATAWSGCEDFLTAKTGYPVASVLRAVRPGEYPFAAGSWAEPDVVQAAAQMRALFLDQQRAERVQRAKALVDASFAREPVAASVAAQLKRIQAILGSSEASGRN